MAGRSFQLRRFCSRFAVKFSSDCLSWLFSGASLLHISLTHPRWLPLRLQQEVKTSQNELRKRLHAEQPRHQRRRQIPNASDGIQLLIPVRVAFRTSGLPVTVRLRWAEPSGDVQSASAAMLLLLLQQMRLHQQRPSVSCQDNKLAVVDVLRRLAGTTMLQLLKLRLKLIQLRGRCTCACTLENVCVVAAEQVRRGGGGDKQEAV